MVDILIVDDSTFSRSRVKKTLVSAGYEVAETDNGRRCLELLGENLSPGCILLDLNMPEMNGFEVLEHLQKAGNQVPIAICTADVQDSTRQRCLEFGVATVLHKPHKKEDLLETVQALLKQKAPKA